MNTNLNELTVEDVLENPTRFGMPTFEEFQKNPDKYKGRADEILESADKSTTVKQFRDLIERQTYSAFGFDCGTSLEKVERVILGEGYVLTDMQMVPRVSPEIGGKVRINIDFVPKARKVKS